jgi:hypothetical protein
MHACIYWIFVTIFCVYIFNSLGFTDGQFGLNSFGNIDGLLVKIVYNADSNSITTTYVQFGTAYADKITSMFFAHGTNSAAATADAVVIGGYSYDCPDYDCTSYSASMWKFDALNPYLNVWKVSVSTAARGFGDSQMKINSVLRGYTADDVVFAGSLNGASYYGTPNNGAVDVLFGNMNWQPTAPIGGGPL